MNKDEVVIRIMPSTYVETVLVYIPTRLWDDVRVLKGLIRVLETSVETMESKDANNIG